MLLSRHGSGRASAYVEANKIVTFQYKTHVAWLDSVADKFCVRIRTLGRRSNRWSPTYTIDEAYDNHGGPALTVDSRGFSAPRLLSAPPPAPPPKIEVSERGL